MKLLIERTGDEPEIANLDAYVAVGFGIAQIVRNDEVIYDEMHAEVWKKLSEFEEMAQKDAPETHWLCILDGPLSGVTYERQGKNLWVAIERNEGFA